MRLTSKALTTLALAAGVGYISRDDTGGPQVRRAQPPKQGRPGNSLTKARVKAKARRKAQQAARRRA